MNDYSNNTYGVDPLGRPRFYGVYIGKVLDIDDPLKKSRIKISVSQPTGGAKTGWAEACLPVTSNANHPDHKEHLAADIAALLTTQSSSTGSGGGLDSHSHSIPALTIVAKSGAGSLDHERKATSDPQETNVTDEHTPHRIVPRKYQEVWVMYVAGDPEFPIWIGVRAE
jgi:hypothetical protein